MAKKAKEAVAAPVADEVVGGIDPTMLEPKPVAPVEETSKTVDVVYMPGPEGPDDTVVASIPFRAYEPVAVNAARGDIIQRLHANPWFGPKVDADRQKAWSDYRAAQKSARDAVDAANALAASKGA